MATSGAPESTTSSRFTVGGHFLLSSLIPGYEINAGLGGPVRASLFPVSLLADSFCSHPSAHLSTLMPD